MSSGIDLWDPIGTPEIKRYALCSSCTFDRFLHAVKSAIFVCRECEWTGWGHFLVSFGLILRPYNSAEKGSRAQSRPRTPKPNAIGRDWSFLQFSSVADGCVRPALPAAAGCVAVRPQRATVTLCPGRAGLRGLAQNKGMPSHA